MQKYNWVEIFDKYGNCHAREIARKINSSANVIIVASRRHGVNLPTGKTGGVERYNWVEIFNDCSGYSIPEIANLKGMNANQIAISSGAHQQTVREASKRYGVKLKKGA